jgi:2'-5' RNA ligase
MTRPRKNLRLFVAVYPPPAVAQRMVDAAERVARARRAPADGYRLTPAEQVHLTIQFVGDVPVRDLARVEESVGRAAAGLCEFALAPRRVIALPARGPRRLLAIETDAPATLLELKRRLAIRLARRTRRRAEDRFLPHLTACRFRTPVGLDPLDEDGIDVDAFAVREVRLMRSALGPDGARHEPVVVHALDGAHG